eukprot:1142362-Amphidinium_carterae.1
MSDAGDFADVTNVQQRVVSNLNMLCVKRSICEHITSPMIGYRFSNYQTRQRCQICVVVLPLQHKLSSLSYATESRHPMF